MVRGKKKVDNANKPKARVEDYSILLEPVITEKVASQGLTVLRVDPRASKDQIKEAVERVFNVQVAGIRTLTTMGKPKRSARTVGRRAKEKKAFITLKPGFELNVVEGI